MTINILNINASLIPQQSSSLKLANHFIDSIKIKTNVNLIVSDLSKAIKPIDDEWIDASFTLSDQRSEEQDLVLSNSNKLIDELKLADEIILSAPMYNFSVPANLKTYFDLISRVGVTFKYTDTGPIGLIDDKPVTVIITTGGTGIGSDQDFMSHYIIQMFKFIGINQVKIVAADKQSINAEESFNKARDQLTHLSIR